MTILTTLLPSLSGLVLVVLTAALVLVALLVYHRSGSAIGTKVRSDVTPYPGGLPLLGNMLQLAGQPRLLEIWAEQVSDKTRDPARPFTLTLPGMRVIDITDPLQIEYVQKTNFENYIKGSLQAGFMKDVLGQGIFASDGHQWLSQRKASSKIFTANHFRGIISTSIDRDIEKLIAIIGDYADKGEAFDLAALFFAYTLSSFTSMAFGQDIGALQIGNNKPVPFAVAFDYAQSRMDARVFEPLFPITELFSEAGREMRKATKTISEFAYKIIDARNKDRAEKDDDAESGSTDLLSLYMALRDEKGARLSREAIRDAIVNLIIAGRDTTAQSLSWTYFHLLSEPALVDAMRSEVEEHANIDYDNFKDCTRVLATFNEGMRLHPSVPKNLKQVVADDVIPNGPKVYAGEYVCWNDWAMARSPRVWGDDAAEFKPARWIMDDGTLKKESQWKAHWFNGGPRLCLGQGLATFSGAMVLAHITRHFDLKFAPGYLENVEMIDIGTAEKTPRYLASLTLPMKDPFLVTASRRKV